MKFRIVIFILSVAVLWGVHHIVLTSVEPVVATDIALEQMNDTTTGHVVNRTYQSGFKKFMESPIIPAGITLMFFYILFASDIKTKLKQIKEVNSNEETN